MGRKLILVFLFSILAALIAAYYGLLPIPWLEDGNQTLGTRNEFVNKSAKILESNSD